MTNATPQRLQPPHADGMSSRQRAVADAIAGGPRGALRGPLAIWLHRPELADRAQSLGLYCRYETLLAPRLSELAILTVAAFWPADYMWRIHAPLAVAAGLAEATVEEIRTGRSPSFDRADETAMHSFATALQRDRQLSDEAYAQAVTVLGEAAVVDLVGLIGYYTLVAMTARTFEATAPGDGGLVFDTAREEPDRHG